MLGGVIVRKFEPRNASELGDDNPKEILLKKRQKFFDKTIEKYFLEVTGKQIKYSKLPRDKRGKILPVKNWFLSVSHSEDYLAVALFDDENVGVDIEKRQHHAKLSRRVLQKVLAPRETIINGDYLNNYVIKEAYAKYLGDGLSFGFSKHDANELLRKDGVKWRDYSTDEYICHVVHDIM